MIPQGTDALSPAPQHDTDDSSVIICGGSSLCPPEYISTESKYEFNAQACDVGFRIVIAAK